MVTTMYNNVSYLGMFAKASRIEKSIQCLQALEAKQRKVEDTCKKFFASLRIVCFFMVPLISFSFLVVKVTIVSPFLFLVWRNVKLYALG